MIEAHGLAAFAIDDEPGVLAGAERAAHDGADVHGEIGPRLERVGDLDQRAVGGLDHAAIPDLAAGLAVEGRLGGDDVRDVAGANLPALVAVHRQRCNLGFGFVYAIADETRRPSCRR